MFFFIPGWAFATITFPGVIIHEIAHRLFCDLTKTPVYEVCYFRVGNPSGYVIHGEVKGLGKSFLISVAPLIINSVFCMLLTIPFVLSLWLDIEHSNPLFILLAWIGFSSGMHAFPSNQDMNNFIEATRKAKNKGLLYLFALPFVFLIKIANFLSRFWFDLFYAVLISCLLPIILMRFL